jgi:pre-mRNA-splicing factor 38A
MSRVVQEDGALAHGTSPHYLIEKIVRLKIYETSYWKEQCFGLNLSTLAERAARLRYAGGTFGTGAKSPTKFMCLLLKMLILLPDQNIVVAFLRNKSLKYLTILAATYLRLVATAKDVYELLEPMLADYRKVRIRNPDGRFEIVYMDQVIDKLLNEQFYFSISLPRLTPRFALEKAGKLDPRHSRLFEFDKDLAEIFGTKASNSKRKSYTSDDDE